MKRIIGRSFSDDRNTTFSDDGRVVPVVDLNHVQEKISTIPRFLWAQHEIVNLGMRGFQCYNVLDVGGYDGTFAAGIMKERSSISDSTSSFIHVDVVELDLPAFKSLTELCIRAQEPGYSLSAYNVKFEEFRSDIKYDVIVAFEMLEHVKDPLFCIEKMYDMLEIGGHLFISLPEEKGTFGLSDKNCHHLWTATVQSVIFSFFSDDRKWKIVQMFEIGGILLFMVRKLTYQA